MRGISLQGNDISCKRICCTEFSKSPFVVVNRLGTELSQMNKGIWRTNEKKKKKKRRKKTEKRKKNQKKKKKKKQTNRKTKKQGNKDLIVQGKFYFVLTP